MASIVGLDFDARQAWPAYNWMGVAKAALESVSRYLARDLGPRGIRVNLISRRSGTHHGGQVDPWLLQPRRRLDRAGAPGLGHLGSDPGGQAACALLSDWFPATTGSMIMVDGGFHALGFAEGESGSVGAAMTGWTEPLHV